APLRARARALTWTPALSHYFIRDARGRRHSESVPPRVMNLYARVLRTTLERPLVLAIASLVVIAFAYVCYRGLGSDLLPEMDEGTIIIDTMITSGAAL